MADKIYDFDDVLPFGKHKGKTIGLLVQKYPAYLTWCQRNIEWFKVTSDVEKVIYEYLGFVDSIDIDPWENDAWSGCDPH